MSTLHLQPSAAPVRFINSRLAVRAALLGLFSAPMLQTPAYAQSAAPSASTPRQTVLPEILVKAAEDQPRAGGKTAATSWRAATPPTWVASCATSR